MCVRACVRGCVTVQEAYTYRQAVKGFVPKNGCRLRGEILRLLSRRPHLYCTVNIVANLVTVTILL